MKFSNTLWQQNAPIYQRIIDHPFNVELAQGTLDQERFLFYIEQDAHYLISFSRALAFIAAWSDSYTQFLIATASTASLEEAIAAVLPCFWIYREMGSNNKKGAEEKSYIAFKK